LGGKQRRHRDQTQEEVIRTRGFAKEVVELLRHSPDLSFCFNKFIPAYHLHFGRQCRVGSYGMTKLIELFEAIPDTVEIREDGEERLVQLTKDKMIWVVGEQVECVVKASRARCVALTDLEEDYQKMYGHLMPLGRMGVGRVEELVDMLQSWVRNVQGKEGKMVVTVDRGFIRTMASNVRRLLGEQTDGEMALEDFIEKMATRYVRFVSSEFN
jgi:meiosis arrest female protein 1